MDIFNTLLDFAKSINLKDSEKTVSDYLLEISKPKRYMCCLCGRDKFTRKSPHNCSGGFRKRNIIWKEIK